MSRAGQAGSPMTVVFGLSYSLGSIPSSTGRLYCQDVARGATNKSRGSEMQDLQPTGPALLHMPAPTGGSQQARRNRRDSIPSLGAELRRRNPLD